MAEPHGVGERGGREPRERTMAGGEQRKYYVDELHGLLASARTELGRVCVERDKARVGREVFKTELAKRRVGDSGSMLTGPVIVVRGGGERRGAGLVFILCGTVCPKCCRILRST